MGHYYHSLIKVRPHPSIYPQFLSFFLLTLSIIHKSITATTYFGSCACCLITGETYAMDPKAQLKQLPSDTSAPSLPHCHLFLNFINAFSRVCRSPRGNRSKSLDIHFCLLLLLLLFLCTTCANTPSAPHSGPCRDAQAQLSFPIASPQIRQLTGSAPAVELCLGRNQRNRSDGDDTVTAALLHGVSVADVGSEKQN